MSYVRIFCEAQDHVHCQKTRGEKKEEKRHTKMDRRELYNSFAASNSIKPKAAMFCWQLDPQTAWCNGAPLGMGVHLGDI